MGYQLAATGLSMVGMLFFIIGAWIVQIALGFALPGMVTHELGVIDSIKRSVAHFREHPKWHLGFWGLGLAVMMIAGNIPFIGYMIGLPFFAVSVASRAAPLHSPPRPTPCAKRINANNIGATMPTLS